MSIKRPDDHYEVPADRPSQPKRTLAKDSYWAIMLRDQADLKQLAVPFATREAFEKAFRTALATNPHLLRALEVWLDNSIVETCVFQSALPGQTVPEYIVEDGWRIMFLDVDQLRSGNFELSVSKAGHFGTTHLKDVLFYNVEKY